MNKSPRDQRLPQQGTNSHTCIWIVFASLTDGNVHYSKVEMTARRQITLPPLNNIEFSSSRTCLGLPPPALIHKLPYHWPTLTRLQHVPHRASFGSSATMSCSFRSLRLLSSLSRPQCSHRILHSSRRTLATVAHDETDATLPLKGLRVLDMTRVLAGVRCSPILVRAYTHHLKAILYTNLRRSGVCQHYYLITTTSRLVHV